MKNYQKTGNKFQCNNSETKKIATNARIVGTYS
jgi:hypothetical protein